MRIIKATYHKTMATVFDRFLNNTMKVIFHDLRFQKYSKRKG